MIEQVDAVVVGAGGMGAATAWRLAARGRSVVLLEQYEHLHQRGSSHGQTRIFRISYRDPLYAGLAGRTIPLWRQLEDQSGTPLLEQTGQLDHGDPTAIDEIHRTLTSTGWTAVRLTAEQAHERWPGMVFDRSVVYSPDGGRVFAERAVDAAVRTAVRRGAVFYDCTPVDRIERAGDGAIVHANGLMWRADVVILSAGPWLPALASDLVPLPKLTVTQQQPVHFAVRDGFSFPSFIHHQFGHVDGRPLEFGAYGLESPGEGVKVGIEDTIREVTTGSRTFEADEAVDAAARAYAERWLPGADTSRMTSVTCLFTETPDTHFILDRVGPFVICSPCSGHGFKFVPMIGELTARLAMGDHHGEARWTLHA